MAVQEDCVTSTRVVECDVPKIMFSQDEDITQNNNNDSTCSEKPKKLMKMAVKINQCLKQEPKLKEVVLMAMKQHEEKLKQQQESKEVHRRRSGPESFRGRLGVPEEMDKMTAMRRMSDTTGACRRVRRRSSAQMLSFRRLSLRASIPESIEDPLEFLLLRDANVMVAQRSRGRLTRALSALTPEHVSCLFNGLTIGVATALVLKSFLLVFYLVLSIAPG